MLKNTLFTALGICLCFVAFGQKNPTKLEKSAMQKPLVLKDARDSMSYAVGVLVGANVRQQVGEELNVEAFQEAIGDMLKGDSLLFSQEASMEVYRKYTQILQQRVAEKQKRYLDENKTKKGVTTTASGLQYEVMKTGAGTVHPTATSKVRVHYHGTLIDGTVFDSSVERNQPAEFPLNGVIKGWTEGLQLMHVGDKFKFTIPAELAYGNNPAPGGKIKPGSTLVFEVELLDILAN